MEILEILKNHSLSITPARTETLELFMKESKALSHAELEKELGLQFDRTTIYRTLNSFLVKGIIHKVPDNLGVNKFALHQHSHTCTSQTGHTHQHIHFKCEQCHSTVCIDEIKLPDFQAPNGFLFNEVSVLVQGICEKCNI